jgi:predicted ATPase
MDIKKMMEHSSEINRREKSLDTLTIRGFKSIRELDGFELKDLNVFVGANGSGKSNLISFFRMLQALIEETLDDFVRDNGGISDLLHNGRKTTQKMEFETRFGSRGYRFSIKPGPGEGFALANESRYYDGGRTGWWDLGSSGDSSSLLVKEAKGKSHDSQYSRPVYNAISAWKIYHFHDTGINAPMRHAEIVEDNKSLRFDASNIGPFLLRLRNEKHSFYDEILNACRLVAPYFDDFLLDEQTLGPKTKVALSWKSKGSDYPMQPYHLSDGSIRFICLATALMQPDPPSTIIIDEPELGLHPEAIRILGELIQDAAKRTQLIIDSCDVEEHLLFSGFDDAGASLSQEEFEKLFQCGGKRSELSSIPKDISDRLEKEAKRHAKGMLAQSLERNSEHFNEARERLWKWAEDLELAAQKELQKTKEQIKGLNREARKAVTLEEQEALQVKIRELEKKKRRQRQKIFDVEDEIEEKRDLLIEDLEKRLSQKVQHNRLFMFRWRVV